MADTASGGGNGISDFFSRVSEIAGGVRNVLSTINPRWTGDVAQDTSGRIQSQPTFSGNSGQMTTSTTAPVENQKTDYMPYVVIGGVVLIAVLLLK